MSKHQILIDNGKYMAIIHEQKIEFWNSQGSTKFGVLSDSAACQDIHSAFNNFASGLSGDTKTILRQLIASSINKLR